MEVDLVSYAIGIGILSLALVFAGLLGLAQEWSFARYGRGKDDKIDSRHSPAWQESLFYLHALALPMFVTVKGDLLAQLAAVQAGPTTSIPIDVIPGYKPYELKIPVAYAPLLLNTLTQVLCVSGVHRLTSLVSSLTLTLILVVRKAVSLVISVVFLRGGKGGNPMMWCGAAMVMLGTFGYSIGGPRRPKEKKE